MSPKSILLKKLKTDNFSAIVCLKPGHNWDFTKSLTRHSNSHMPLVPIVPYKTNFASLMYVGSRKNKAAIFVYNLESLEADTYPALKMNGFDPNKKYKIIEVNSNC